jgi:hypothetical protein
VHHVVYYRPGKNRILLSAIHRRTALSDNGGEVEGIKSYTLKYLKPKAKKAEGAAE